MKKKILKISAVYLLGLSLVNNAFAWGQNLQNKLKDCVNSQTKIFLQDKSKQIILQSEVMTESLKGLILDNCNQQFQNVIIKAKIKPQFAFSTYITYEANNTIKLHNQFVQIRKEIEQIETEKKRKAEKEARHNQEYAEYINNIAQLDNLENHKKLAYLFELEEQRISLDKKFNNN